MFHECIFRRYTLEDGGLYVDHVLMLCCYFVPDQTGQVALKSGVWQQQHQQPGCGDHQSTASDMVSALQARCVYSSLWPVSVVIESVCSEYKVGVAKGSFKKSRISDEPRAGRDYVGDDLEKGVLMGRNHWCLKTVSCGQILKSGPISLHLHLCQKILGNRLEYT